MSNWENIISRETITEYLIKIDVIKFIECVRDNKNLDEMYQTDILVLKGYWSELEDSEKASIIMEINKIDLPFILREIGMYNEELFNAIEELINSGDKRVLKYLKTQIKRLKILPLVFNQ